MPKRARYDGAYEEVHVYDPETGNQYVVATVKRGGLLPTTIEHESHPNSGQPMPASLRDSLIDNGEWTAVNESKPRKPRKKKATTAAAAPAPAPTPPADEPAATPAGEES